MPWSALPMSIHWQAARHMAPEANLSPLDSRFFPAVSGSALTEWGSKKPYGLRGCYLQLECQGYCSLLALQVDNSSWGCCSCDGSLRTGYCSQTSLQDQVLLQHCQYGLCSEQERLAPLPYCSL